MSKLLGSNQVVSEWKSKGNFPITPKTVDLIYIFMNYKDPEGG